MIELALLVRRQHVNRIAHPIDLRQQNAKPQVYKPMEGTVKARLLLTSTLFLFVQIQAQAQVMVDVSKVTCAQLLMGQPFPTKYALLWFSG